MPLADQKSFSNGQQVLRWSLRCRLFRRSKMKIYTNSTAFRHPTETDEFLDRQFAG